MSAPIAEATPDTFDALVFAPRDRLIVVDFWGANCPNCEVFAREAPSLLEALAGEAVSIVRVDAYTHEALACRFGLFGIPTFLLVRDGRLLGKMSQYYGRAHFLSVVRERLPARAGSPPAPPR